MFLGSGKDMRKGASKSAPAGAGRKPGSSAGPSATSAAARLHGGDSIAQPKNTDNVVERAKQERLNRQCERERTIKAIKLQAWFRGTWARSSRRKTMRNEVQSKFNDIEKLANLLKAKGATFCPPVNVALDLLRKMIAIKVTSGEDVTLFAKFCDLVLIPSLGQLEYAKNLLPHIIRDRGSETSSVYLALKLSDILLTTLSPKWFRRLNAEQLDKLLILAKALFHMFGGSKPYRMRFTDGLEDAFQRVRNVLVSRNFYGRIREVLIALTEPLIERVASEDDVFTAGPKKSEKPTVADVLVQMSIHVALADSLAESEERLTTLAKDVMSVPMLTAVLSTGFTFALANWVNIHPLLNRFDTSMQLPPSPHFVFQSGLWLLGNICALAPYMKVTSHGDAVPTSQMTENASAFTMTLELCDVIADDILERYLDVVLSLLRRYCVLGILQGRSGVAWVQAGASLTAAGVPIALQEQIYSLYRPEYAKSLYERILLPVRDDVIAYGNEEDRVDVSGALTSSGLKIARDNLQEQQESSVFFSSKWAKKMVSGAAKSLGLKKRSATQSAKPMTAEQVAQQLSESIMTEQRELPDCRYALNVRLVAKLSEFWGLLFVHATGAPSDSMPWRCLSSIAFSTRSVDRLWTLLLSVDMTSLNKRRSTRTPSTQMGSVSIKKASTSNEESSVGAGSSSSGFSFMSIFGGGKPDKKSSSTRRLSSSTDLKEAGQAQKRLYVGVTQLENFADRFSPECDLVSDSPNPFPTLMALTSLLRLVLVALDDSELYSQGRPLPLDHFLRLVRNLKILLFKLLQEDPHALSDSSMLATGKNPAAQVSDAYTLQKAYRSTAVKLICSVLSDLYSRWARRPFSSSSLWEVEEADTGAIRAQMRSGTSFATTLMHVMPWAIGFHERMRLFRDVFDEELRRVQGGTNSADPLAIFSSAPRSRGVNVTVRRARIVEDGMAAMKKVGSNIKDRVQVRYVNDFGEEEPGIDAGGLFKDFLTDLSSRVFDPNYGLFCLTASQTLYPNPAAVLLYEDFEVEALYEFLGRVLGKALFENITLQPQFSHFFLAFMHGRYNFMNLFNDLATLDEELYKNLMFLKTFEGDIADLCLTFSVTDDALGGNKEIDLIAGGSNIAVTSSNRHRYINLVAKYYLHDRLKRQAAAFFHGLFQVIGRDMLSMFCPPELQILISGANSGISVDDFKRYTGYAGGYSSLDRHMSRFWAIVEGMNEQDRGLLLKFVTACERPPSLGFAALQPPFTIQRVECNDDSRLPTASTCFNILKLPTYSSEQVMRDKLLTSIRANAGFDLS